MSQKHQPAALLLLAELNSTEGTPPSPRSNFWMHQFKNHFAVAIQSDCLQLETYGAIDPKSLTADLLKCVHVQVKKTDGASLSRLIATTKPQLIVLVDRPNKQLLSSALKFKTPLIIWGADQGKSSPAELFIKSFYRALSQNRSIKQAFTEANLQVSLSDEQAAEKADIYYKLDHLDDDSFPTMGLLVNVGGNALFEQSLLPENFTAEKTPAVRSLAAPRTKLHSDRWSQEDFLGYELYANVITQLIKDDESLPPLTIAIIAPWGQGKTTLMRYIKRQLEKQPAEPAQEEGAQQRSRISQFPKRLPALKPTKNYKKITKWLVEGPEAKYGDFQPEKYPTVWFNPWEYQSTDQIWSGMAHAIINQLVDKLPPYEQEEFWFKLRLRRVDRHEVRREVFKTVMIQLVPNLIWIFIGLFLIIIGTIVGKSLEDMNLMYAVSGAGGTVSLVSLLIGLVKKQRKQQSGVVETYEKLFKAPNYEANLGLFHEVNQDLKRVMKLLVSIDQPIVIFIDDLDRCSHSRVVEVIEAINLMMSGEFRDRCYFVLGMDAEVVAAALDVAYQDVHGKLSDRERQLGSVGWYFLDKFIQLPFIIPTLSGKNKEDYLSRLFDMPPEEEENTGRKLYKTEQIESAAADLLKNYHEEQTEGIYTIRQDNSEWERELDLAFLKLAFKANRDSNEILEQVKTYAPYLQASPRSLKRFANMLRFYTSIQQLRETKGQTVAELSALAKWLTISLRWPLLVRWVQYAYENRFIDKINYQRDATPIVSDKPIIKAEALDRVISTVKQEIAKHEDENAFKEIYFSQWLSFCDDNSHLPWLSDRDLYKILMGDHGETAGLKHALDCGVW